MLHLMAGDGSTYAILGLLWPQLLVAAGCTKWVTTARAADTQPTTEFLW
jgi:hypothetical protein